MRYTFSTPPPICIVARLLCALQHDSHVYRNIIECFGKIVVVGVTWMFPKLDPLLGHGMPQY